MTASIVNLPKRSRKKPSLSKPLKALDVKNHKEGVLADAHPYKGLRLRANKRGGKTWIYRYRVGDKLRQIKLGTYPGMSLSQARQSLTEQRKLREQHQDPRKVAAERKREAERRDFTFAVMVEQYLTERVELNRKEKGADEARRLLEKDLGDLRDRLVEEVTPVEIHDHIRAIAKRAPYIALNFRAELARAWRIAANTGRTTRACPINPDTGGKLKQGKRERHLSPEELRRLLPWMHNYSDTVADALLLTLYLGLRSGEVCKLRDEWLTEEEDGYWITIPAAEMKKQHSDHSVPLAGTALKIALKRAGGGYWFPSKAGPHIHQKILGVQVYAHSGRSKAKVYRSKEVCPVTDWAPNDLRKTARTRLAALGCPFEVAESILHHRLPGVGGLCNQHTYDEEEGNKISPKRKWLTKLGEWLDSPG